MPPAKSKLVSTTETARQLLDKIEYVLLDVDGVLVSGSRVLPGVPEALDQLRRLGKKLRVVTNNSTKPIPVLEKQFAKLGIPFHRDEIMNSGSATANYLVNLCPTKPIERGNVFVLGSEGLVQDIRAVLPKNRFVYGPEIHPDRNTHHPFNALVKTANLAQIGEAIFKKILPPPEQTLVSTNSSSSQSTSTTDPAQNDVSIESLNISCVVVGLDPSFTLTKLCIANMCLRHPGRKCDFIATNSDPQFPIAVHGADGTSPATALLPGGGTLVAALSVAADRKPDVEVGKPQRYMFDVIADREIRRYNLKETPEEFAKKCLMIGDRLTTDVMFGKNSGTRTCLVLTGCETEDHIESTGIIPDFFAPSLGKIGELLKALTPVSKI